MGKLKEVEREWIIFEQQKRE
ncbi:Protein CBG27185 [Caenorhabditis briggsae]|uniref:Protein CBG27185 n=1 Tax=Caenorhabditis briggsae TaxID=6238 RepID=B6IL15_CAEBR|nr:Protein CBG27185 [Caenorhabditis briggsae]CAS00648.1 Protein CBG27185 [Caenorhabditis briggsae]